ncbi:hypothetical protein DTL21_04970 [Bremerella cremea]|uniref:Uncharacterized protein n=1 Tax=Blastopirellula marina TaxID=124 RepID=A0A2S8FYN9_9BACT|nr:MULTISPECIES: hypothetical protein [Pirellulaceae]PQO37302.1 hypothetical protein C5Y83_04970 [Blastopirellula marina]RCS49689.1 hypothetical protein DTL21_04970 [Bremerella cremea]
MDGPRRTYGQLVSATLTILVAIWFAGILLSWIPRINENPLSMVVVAIIGPGLIAFQQYRSTFRANLSAARFCMVLTCFSSVFVALIFVIAICITAFTFLTQRQPFPLVPMVIFLASLTTLGSVASSNLRWWLELQTWYERDWQPPVARQFSLSDTLLLTLAVGIAFGVANHWSTTYR